MRSLFSGIQMAVPNISVNADSFATGYFKR
jgi:hypothetical protein